MNIQQYGFSPTALAEHASAIPARVTAVFRDLFEIVCDHGSGLARLKSGAYRAGGEAYPTTGDFVLVHYQQNGESLIIKTLPRKTYFSRRDPSGAGYEEQAIAANFDDVFIMQPLDRPINERSLERYLTLAWQSGAIPSVVLTKADTAEDYLPQLRCAERIAAGVGIYVVSAKTGYGISRLEDYLKAGKTVVFLGSSGIGKSSLVNALAKETVMRTNEIREQDGRGRHTTTHRQLLLLSSGVMVIDTPGMRELGMWEADQGLAQSFSDVEAILGHCKFSDCRHQGEPGCAIAQALSSGELSQDRWESHQKLEAESRFAGDKAGYLREKEQWRKEIAKTLRQ